MAQTDILFLWMNVVLYKMFQWIAVSTQIELCK